MPAVVLIFEMPMAQRCVVVVSLPVPMVLQVPLSSAQSKISSSHQGPVHYAMPCRGASCLKSLDLVSAFLRSEPLALSRTDIDMDGACLRSGLLVLETMVSRVVTVCLSVRRSRSSMDLMPFVRGLPDSVLLCASRSWANLGDAFPPLCGFGSNGLREVLSVFMRGMRADVFSPAAAPLDAPLPAP